MIRCYCDICGGEIEFRPTIPRHYDVCEKCNNLIGVYIRELTDRIAECVYRNTDKHPDMGYIKETVLEIIDNTGLPKYKKEGEKVVR